MSKVGASLTVGSCVPNGKVLITAARLAWLSSLTTTGTGACETDALAGGFGDALEGALAGGAGAAFGEEAGAAFGDEVGAALGDELGVTLGAATSVGGSGKAGAD